MKKTITKLFIVFFLMVIYAYALVIDHIPEELVVFEGETIQMKTIAGIRNKRK